MEARSLKLTLRASSFVILFNQVTMGFKFWIILMFVNDRSTLGHLNCIQFNISNESVVLQLEQVYKLNLLRYIDERERIYEE